MHVVALSYSHKSRYVECLQQSWRDNVDVSWSLSPCMQWQCWCTHRHAPRSVVSPTGSSLFHALNTVTILCIIYVYTCTQVCALIVRAILGILQMVSIKVCKLLICCTPVATVVSYKDNFVWLKVYNSQALYNIVIMYLQIRQKLIICCVQITWLPYSLSQSSQYSRGPL